MGRVTRRPVFKFRFRRPGKVFGSKFFLSKGTPKGSEGRILSRRKLSFEELNRIDEYLPFDPEALLREFRGVKSKGGLS